MTREERLLIGWNRGLVGQNHPLAGPKIAKKLIGNRNPVTHGLSDGPEYHAWESARQRCTNSRNPAFKNYGGRGIQFLFRSFEEFLEELGLRPVGMTLDRIDNQGHYEYGNVRWTTRLVQNSNKRPRHAS
jgi:hypothetical protein